MKMGTFFLLYGIAQRSKKHIKAHTYEVSMFYNGIVVCVSLYEGTCVNIFFVISWFLNRTPLVHISSVFDNSLWEEVSRRVFGNSLYLRSDRHEKRSNNNTMRFDRFKVGLARSEKPRESRI